MQGKDMADLAAEREAIDRKNILDQELLARERAAAEATIQDEFEMYSEASAPIDNIVAVRATEPMKFKPGREAAHLQNDSFFRQAETNFKEQTRMQMS